VKEHGFPLCVASSYASSQECSAAGIVRILKIQHSPHLTVRPEAEILSFTKRSLCAKKRTRVRVWVRTNTVQTEVQTVRFTNQSSVQAKRKFHVLLSSFFLARCMTSFQEYILVSPVHARNIRVISEGLTKNSFLGRIWPMAGDTKVTPAAQHELYYMYILLWWLYGSDQVPFLLRFFSRHPCRAHTNICKSQIGA
jgi:hypothetical protein